MRLSQQLRTANLFDPKKEMKTRIVKTCCLFTAVAAAAVAQTPDFLMPAAFPTGGSSAYVAVADLNRDKIPDIVTYESVAQSLSILFGNPDGTFQPAVTRVLGFPAT